MSKIKVRVTSTSKEMVFEVLEKMKAKALFAEICKNLSFRETWYFGLFYKNNLNELVWIDQSKKKMREYRSAAMILQLGIKYFPENVEQDLIELITIQNFFIQVRSSILSEEMYCPPDTCVLLASYAVHIKYGDYDEKIDISKEQLLPERIFQKHNLGKQEFNENITLMWQKHSGLLREEAMVEYLKIAQNLEMFGVHYYQIMNAKGTRIWLGVYPLGLNIYKQEDRLNPAIMFPWSEISNLSIKGKKFTIKMNDKTSEDFVFHTDDEKLNKRIMILGVGYHQLYIRRRQPESLEVLQMREQAALQKKTLESHRNKWREEIKTRELIEKQYKQELSNLRQQIEDSERQLRESKETIERLNKKLEEVELAKNELEKRQNELEALMLKLEASKNLEATEKQKLEDEIRAKQLEVERIRAEVHEKDEESRRLQEEMDEAKRRQEEYRKQKEEEEARRLQEQQHLEELAAQAHSEIPKLAEVNEQLKEQLAKLQGQLESTRNESAQTVEDKIHRTNLLDGRDKFKTLHEIRRGNTTRRVELFETF